MDRYLGKRSAGGIVIHRKGSISYKDTACKEDQNARFCNRIGCNGRIKYSQNAKIGSSHKVKISKPSFGSSDGNEINGKFSRSSSVMARAKKSNPGPKTKLPSQVNFDQSESSLSSESEAPGLVPSPNSLSGYQLGSLKSGEVTRTESRSSSASSNVMALKNFHHKSGLRNHNIPQVPSVPLASGSSLLGPLNRDNGRRYGLRNLKCNSMSDVLPASCSSLESEYVGQNKMKKRSSEGESSFSRRGSNISAASCVSPSASGISISDSSNNSSSGDDSRRAASVSTCRSMNVNTRMRLSSRQNGRSSSSVRQPATRISQVPDKEIPSNVGGQSFSNSRRNIYSREDSGSAASAWTRRSTNGNTRIRLSSRQNGRNSSSVRQPSVGVSQVLDSEIPSNADGPSSVRQFSARGSTSYSLSRSNGDNPSITMPRDALYRYSTDESAELLLALERMEQDADPTHEVLNQLLALETSLFLNSLNRYDQHRDMRLDIDNMSYEELLALEERMGTVSTALSEAALPKCLKRSIYQETPSKLQITGSGEDEDDIKCSICQEEYVVGDEIGKLVKCQHGYHITCINQWLRLKNWCPICKASAAPSEPSE